MVYQPSQQLQIVRELAFGSGHQGMVGGQVMDIQAENQEVEFSHLKKFMPIRPGN